MPELQVTAEQSAHLSVARAALGLVGRVAAASGPDLPIAVVTALSERSHSDIAAWSPKE